LSVASHKRRRWIGVDNSPLAISTTMRRFGKGLEPMGDFVSKLESAERDQESEAALSLFGPEETAKPTPKQKNCHQTIADFALIAQEPYQGDFADVLEQWTDWNGESNVLKLAENPVAYRTGKPKKPKHCSKYSKREC